jgi:hypothetical protein
MVSPDTMNTAVPIMKRRRPLLQGLLFVAAYASLLVTTAPTVCVHAFSPEASKNHKASVSAVEAELFPASFRNLNAQSRNTQKTARESAVLVEWERMSELDRRIEDRVNYEHYPEQSDSNYLAGRKNQNAAGRRKVSSSKEDTAPQTRGVFCGFRTTKEEIDRLKSADPHARV